MSALWLTLALAAISTGALLLLATPLAWWLARTSSWVKIPVSALVMLPMVLPPTVLGFYLLLAFSPESPLGALHLAFSFRGLILGSMIYSLPFVVQPIQNAFLALGQRPIEVAYTLRQSPLRAFFRVALPLARPGILAATVLGFAHTIGEFGVVLMIGGNIPGKTRVLSIALFDYVETQQFAEAHQLAAGLLIFSFLILAVFTVFNRKKEIPWMG